MNENVDPERGGVRPDASEGSWTQQAKLTPFDGDSEDSFGSSVAVAADGTTALVGAQLDEDPNRLRGGAAYVFEKSDCSSSSTGQWRPTVLDHRRRQLIENVSLGTFWRYAGLLATEVAAKTIKTDAAS